MTERLALADQELAGQMAEFYGDPLGFVIVAYPWGEPGTPLANYDGPCPCQRKVLQRLGEEVRKRKFDGVHPVAPIIIFLSSGHGIGKSVLAAMIVGWAASTRPFLQGTVTANTKSQLATKTWARIRTWMQMCITSHWFETNAERLYRIGAKNSWFVAALTSNPDNAEAFQGQHAADSTSLYIFDEASSIEDPIWEASDGGLTDGEPIFLALGNATRNQGRFFRAITKGMRNCISITVDSRDCPLTNKELIQDWVDEHGEDSDYVRVRVRGLPPRSGDTQFIPLDLVRAAQRRPAIALATDPLIAGCDLAWGGEDYNTVRFRKGRDARSIPPVRISGEKTRDPNVMVRALADVLDRPHGPWKDKVAMLFLDSAGICGPVAARLRTLGYTNIQEVNFGADALSPKYAYMRSYMYGQLKEDLLAGLAIDAAPELEEDLTALQYWIDRKIRIQLEGKSEVKERIGHSTDDGDALALTYAMPVAARPTLRSTQWRRLTAWS